MRKTPDTPCLKPYSVDKLTTKEFTKDRTLTFLYEFISVDLIDSMRPVTRTLISSSVTHNWDVGIWSHACGCVFNCMLISELLWSLDLMSDLIGLPGWLMQSSCPAVLRNARHQHTAGRLSSGLCPFFPHHNAGPPRWGEIFLSTA